MNYDPRKVDPSNPDHLDVLHTQSAIASRIDSATEHNYMGDFVLGAIDGTITTFAIVASAAGAGLSGGMAVILGVANVLADGFSMAASNYLKSKADRANVSRYRKIEEMHINEVPDAEREEIRQIYAAKGFEGESLENIVKIITSDRKRWVDTMLQEEWGLQLDSPDPVRAALSTFVAFFFCGAIPIFPMFLVVQQQASSGFLLSASLTTILFFVIGYFKGRILQEERPLLAGIETLGIGLIAALAAWGAGVGLEKVLF